jgi:hypothetical protein
VLKRTGRRHDAVGLDLACAGCDQKPTSAGLAHRVEHLNPFADRRFDHCGVIYQIVRHTILGDKGIRRLALKFHIGEPVMPDRSVGHQRIPAPAAPGFGSAVFLQHQMRHPGPAKMFTHGDAGLSAPDDQRISLFHGHVRLPLCFKGAFGPVSGDTFQAKVEGKALKLRFLAALLRLSLNSVTPCSK